MSNNGYSNNSANSQEQTGNNEKKEKAWLLNLQGKTQTQIAEELGVTQGTISNWLKEIRNEGKERIKDLGHEGLGFMLYSTLEGLNLVISKAWDLYDQKKDHKILNMISNLLLEKSRLLSDLDLYNTRKNIGGYVWDILPIEAKAKMRKKEKEDNDTLMFASI